MPNAKPIALSWRQKKLGYFYLIISLFFLPVILPSVNSLLAKPLNAPWLNFVYYCLNLGVLGWLFRDLLKKSLEITVKHPLSILVIALAGFCLYRLCAFLFGFLISLADPNFSNVNDSNIADQLSENYLVMAMGTVVLVPTAEELMHRGLVFGSLYEKNKPLAYMVSTALFAATHVMGYVGAFPPLTLLLCFLQYLPAGLILALSYEKSGSMATPILIHTLVNLMGLLALR